MPRKKDVAAGGVSFVLFFWGFMRLGGGIGD